MEIIGALGIVDPQPLNSDPTKLGDVGIIAFRLREGKLTPEDIVEFYTLKLPPLLHPYPQSRSAVQLDNMPSHRSHVTCSY
jgi:hypothetical protein